MDEIKAKRALAAVEAKYAKWLSFDDAKGTENGPKLMADWGLGTTTAAWCVVWEQNSPDEWALRWGLAKREDPSGIYTEPMCSFALGVYDDF